MNAVISSRGAVLSVMNGCKHTSIWAGAQRSGRTPARPLHGGTLCHDHGTIGRTELDRPNWPPELADSLLEAIDGPEALRRLDDAELGALGGGDPGGPHRRRSRSPAATSAPTSARSSSRWRSTGCSTRPATSSSGTPVTRPTSTRSSPAGATGSTGLRQAGGLSGYPSPGRVRARLGREQPRVDDPQLRPRPGVARDAAPTTTDRGRRGDRRRLDDRRHGVRGAQQPRPHRPARDRSSSTTTAGRYAPTVSAVARA